MSDPHQRVPDHYLGKVCIGVGVGAAILGPGRYPDLGDLNDGTPRFLVCLRGNLRTTPNGPGVRNDPNTWDFPGGGIDFGEHRYKALRREITEELGVTLRRIQELGTTEHFVGQGEHILEHWVTTLFLGHMDPRSPAPRVPESERSKLVQLRFLSVSELHRLPLAGSMPASLQLLERQCPDLIA